MFMPSRRPKTSRNNTRLRPAFESLETRITPVQSLAGSVSAWINNLGPPGALTVSSETTDVEPSLTGVDSINNNDPIVS